MNKFIKIDNTPLYIPLYNIIESLKQNLVEMTGHKTNYSGIVLSDEGFLMYYTDGLYFEPEKKFLSDDSGAISLFKAIQDLEEYGNN